MTARVGGRDRACVDENGSVQKLTYPLYHGHLRLVRHPAALRVRPVAVAQFTIRVSIAVPFHRSQLLALPKRRVEPGDVVPQEGRNGLAHEFGWLVDSPAVAVVPGGLVGVRHDIGAGGR